MLTCGIGGIIAIAVRKEIAFQNLEAVRDSWLSKESQQSKARWSRLAKAGYRMSFAIANVGGYRALWI